MFLIVFMYALWSTVFPIGKLTLLHSPPLFLTATRMLLAGLLLLGFLAIRNRSSFRITLKQFFSISIVGLLSIYLANAFEFWGLQHLTAAKTCFIYSLSPFLTAFFAYLHFGEKMNRRKWLGMTIGFAGILPVLFAQKGAGELLSSIPFLSWPELAVIGASICSVYGGTLFRLLVKDTPTSPLLVNAISMTFGGLIALAHSALIDTWAPLPIDASHTPHVLRGIAIMTLISNIICYNLFGYLLKRFTTTLLSFMGLFSPIFASLSSWLILGEPPSPIIFLSTGIVIAGLWLVYSAELAQGYIRKDKPVTEVSA